MKFIKIKTEGTATKLSQNWVKHTNNHSKRKKKISFFLLYNTADKKEGMDGQTDKLIE